MINNFADMGKKKNSKPKGMSDKELIKKYDKGGQIDFGKILKKVFKKKK